MGTLMGTPNGEVNSSIVIAKTVAFSPHLTPRTQAASWARGWNVFFLENPKRLKKLMGSREAMAQPSASAVKTTIGKSRSSSGAL